MNDLHDLFDWFWFETLNGESSTGRARLVGPVLNGVFFSRDRSVCISPISPLILLTENARIITCLDTFSNGHGSRSTMDFNCFYRRFGAGSIIVGGQPWQLDWRVTEALVKLSSSLNLAGHLDSLIKSSALSFSDNEYVCLFGCSIGDFEIRILATALPELSNGSGFEYQSFFLDFRSARGVEIKDLRRIFVNVMAFISLIEGRKVGFEFVKIVPDGAPDLSFNWNFSRKYGVKSNSHLFPIDHLKNANDTSRFCRNLEEWILRCEEWKPAYLGLERYFDYNGIFEGGRLVEACSWLDSIPTIGTPQRIPDNEHIRIKEVIYDALRQAQLEDYAAQVIARLKIGVSVSHRERLGEIVKKYYQGSDDRISEVIDVAARAFNLRGRFVHRVSEVEDQESFVKIIESTTIMECLCLQEMFFPCLTQSPETTGMKVIQLSTIIAAPH